jgi:Lambda phage tail tube protein, TTP
MTTQKVQIGYGNLFQLWDLDASPPMWVTVARVVDITPINYTRDAPDATHTESPDGFREFLPGLADGGEIGVTLKFVPDSYTTDMILATFTSKALQNARVLFADGDQDGSPMTCSTFTAPGIVTGFSAEAPMEDGQNATITYKISGKPSFVRASAQQE